MSTFSGPTLSLNERCQKTVLGQAIFLATSAVNERILTKLSVIIFAAESRCSFWVLACVVMYRLYTGHYSLITTCSATFQTSFFCFNVLKLFNGNIVYKQKLQCSILFKQIVHPLCSSLYTIYATFDYMLKN